MPDAYETLQVSRRAEAEVIAAAYRSLARKYHPDGNAGAKGTRRMQEINAAYEILKDPIKRKAYDRAHPFSSAPIRYRDEEVIDWWGTADPEESTDWATSYRRRRSHPVPIPRKGFWGKNWAIVILVLLAAFMCWQVAAAIALKL
jgi:curved DNA-binding protein CbpA